MAVDVRRCGGATLMCVSVRCSAGRTAPRVGGSAREYVYTAIEPALLLKCVVNTDRRLRDRWEIVSP